MGSRSFCLFIVFMTGAMDVHADSAMDPWLVSQDWTRDSDGPVLSLGHTGQFDDTHMFAPAVIYEDGVYSMYYCGSQADVANRVFAMGLATSTDGINFTRISEEPVFRFGDGTRSVLTPTFLRSPDGSVLRENGRLRMWFSSTDFPSGDGIHTLHETFSKDGKTWDAPSPALLTGVYAPTILRVGEFYRMWYTDVSAEPWVIRHAISRDGTQWHVAEKPCIELSQDWETRRLFYPAVLKFGARYCMWYGAYWTARDNTTALGFAISDDGLTWLKHPGSPVYTPDPSREWESHYTTSQSVLRDADGSLRIWYATRPAPPFEHKYFAIGTARWERGFPAESEKRIHPVNWPERSATLREWMAATLTLPSARVPLDPQTHRERELPHCRIESISYQSEAGSRVTALFYLPKDVSGPVPAILIACGHGGSKSALYAQYAGQLYASMGFAVLVPDTIGEEERNVDGKMGSRAHDLYRFSQQERIDFVQNTLKRSILGKMAWDLLRGVDYLAQRPEVDPGRIGLAGNSLGGTSAGCVGVLEPRIHATLISGWGFTRLGVVRGKECTRLPYEEFARVMSFAEMTALFAPHSAALFYSGDRDLIIDSFEDGAALVRYIKANVAGAQQILDDSGISHDIGYRIAPGADHRPLFLAPDSVLWFQERLMNEAERRPLPDETVKFGEWADRSGQPLEKLYSTEERQYGLIVPEMGVEHLPPPELACFPGEVGNPEYTFEGWMDLVLGR
ncbi:MAG: acetylxylan esterase [Candidatus Hydrogenedentes bacterium]|nr:acetylxylan esterase [Candidatus Hydrogenedentota bacterium]